MPRRTHPEARAETARKRRAALDLQARQDIDTHRANTHRGSKRGPR